MEGHVIALRGGGQAQNKLGSLEGGGNVELAWSLLGTIIATWDGNKVTERFTKCSRQPR